MNIYLHVENAARELDSKLLLATIAASRGHNVLVSSISGISRGMRSGILAPGIFHTKSLTPGFDKIKNHQRHVDNGFVVTSIDEEGGLVDHGYDHFAKWRYSGETLGQASAAFGWGHEDTEALKRIYPKHSSKIHNTGSPRADLWKPFFSDYWGTPEGKPQRPFLLISSNMGLANNVDRFHKIIKNHKKFGYYQRRPETFAQHFGMFAEEGRMILAFIEAIQYLSHHNNGYDIVLRPHLNESVEAWKIYLEGIPDVHVIRKGPINAWLNKAFAVMHNGCTTALEATVSGKPVITYVPFNQDHARGLANELGYRVESPNKLMLKINSLFEEMQSSDQKNINQQIPEIVSKKINLDNDKLAAERIIEVWESLDNDNLSKSSNWIKLNWFLNFMKLRDMIGVGLKKLFPKKFGLNKENHKFPSLKRNDIYGRVSRLQSLLGIDKKLECKLFSDRTILIKRHQNLD